MKSWVEHRSENSFKFVILAKQKYFGWFLQPLIDFGLLIFIGRNKFERKFSEFIRRQYNKISPKSDLIHSVFGII